jgi:hypothetical protein
MGVNKKYLRSSEASGLMISTRFTMLFQDEQPQSRIIYEKKAYIQKYRRRDYCMPKNIGH